MATEIKEKENYVIQLTIHTTLPPHALSFILLLTRSL